MLHSNININSTNLEGNMLPFYITIQYNTIQYNTKHFIKAIQTIHLPHFLCTHIIYWQNRFIYLIWPIYHLFTNINIHIRALYMYLRYFDYSPDQQRHIIRKAPITAQCLHSYKLKFMTILLLLWWIPLCYKMGIHC